MANIVRYSFRTIKLNQTGETITEMTSDWRPVLFSQDGRRVLFALIDNVETPPPMPSAEEQAMVDEDIARVAAEMEAAQAEEESIQGPQEYVEDLTEDTKVVNGDEEA